MTLVKSTGGKGNKLRSEAVNAMPSKEIMSDSAQ
jgi:hypothetical protein